MSPRPSGSAFYNELLTGPLAQPFSEHRTSRSFAPPTAMTIFAGFVGPSRRLRGVGQHQGANGTKTFHDFLRRLLGMSQSILPGTDRNLI